jgi:hypothetical protein
MTQPQQFHDELVTPGTQGLPDGFFDRFVFNLHPTDASSPSVLLGHGLYPGKDTVDGFAILVTDDEQRNVRWSTELSATDGRSGGPFAFEVMTPMEMWHLTLGPNPTEMELDVTWEARTPAWTGEVAVTNASGAASSFEHLFQSGRYTGTLTIDGETQPVDGWYGQRDRSRGVRTMSGGQGLHIWFQAQFPDRSVGFLLVETREGERLLLEGAVMQEDGGLDDIVDVVHDLRFGNGGLDLEGGELLVTTASGATYPIAADASAGGGFMSGGGYGGHHGQPRGRDHLEHDVYPLDGSVNQQTLDSSLTDRLASFNWDGTPGNGIFEFALSRSSSYTYKPTLD